MQILTFAIAATRAIAAAATGVAWGLAELVATPPKSKKGIPERDALWGWGATVLLFAHERSGLGVDTCAELLVEHVETISVVLNHADIVDDGAGVLFFLHLLVDKPL